MRTQAPRTAYRGSSAGTGAADRRPSASRARASRNYYGAGYVSGTVAEALPERRGPAISVVSGAGRRTEGATIARKATGLAAVVFAAMVVLTLFGFARIGLISASANTALETQQLTADISQARSEGSQLEVAQSVLSNPVRIKEEAAALGMAAPTAEMTTNIDISGDVVAVDETGALSLSESTALLGA